nr:malonyl CoA-ACP transacylase [Dactylosporangium thailandense]
MIAALVGDVPITVADVNARLAGMRAGPLAARLPHPGSAEGRNLRRWLVQLLAATAVVEQEARGLGLPAAPPAEPPALPPTLPRALRLGGVTAAVLAARPDVYAAVTADVTVGEERVRDYWDRNRDRHHEPYARCRDAIAALLLREARDRHFTRWLDERCAARVRLMPGFEHPGDPAQPDYTHHH